MENVCHGKFGLTGNQLKIVAMLTMLCDHVGFYLLPEMGILRIIGRLSFPIYAFMIAEGCRYTKNRTKYLLSVFLLGLACQVVYFVFMQSLWQCVLITFSLAIGNIYLLDLAREKKRPRYWLLWSLGIVATWFLCVELPGLLPQTDFYIDYGFLGVMVPVFVYLGQNRWQKLFLMSGPLALLAASTGDIQWFSFASVALLALYNGKRGKRKMKYLFYLFYPLHLAALYGIKLLLEM